MQQHQNNMSSMHEINVTFMHVFLTGRANNPLHFAPNQRIRTKTKLELKVI